MKSKTILKPILIFILTIILLGCNSEPKTESEFKDYVIGTWISGGEEVMPGYTVKQKYEIRQDGTVVISSSTNGGDYVCEVSTGYTIGSGIWDDSKETRYFIRFGRYEFNLVNGYLIYQGTYIGGEEEVIILSKE